MQMSTIEKETKEFLLRNKRRYHIYKQVHQYIKDLTSETYQEVLTFVKENSDVFFNDHSSAINFFGFIKNSISCNVKHLELIFDIVFHFIDEFKRLKITENEILCICIQYINYVNYLFQKKIISLTTIIEQSNRYPVLFINFLPEIREFDPEYAKIRESHFFEGLSGPILSNLEKLKKSVDLDPQQHIKNREINYHPSPLHKCIREDDIDTFQSLLSKNGIGINYRIEYSIYERTQPHENSSSLIQTATIYGSKKIVKFLLLQQNLILDDNLIAYSFFSYDLNMIHEYEQRGCSLDNITYMPIYLHQKDILNYYLENHSDHISETNNEVKNAIEKQFKSDDDDDNLYNLLNYDDLQYALLAYNYSIIKKCLYKIAFIVKNVELSKNNNISIFSIPRNLLLLSTGYQFDIFKFLYSQKEGEIQSGCYYFLMNEFLKRNMNDAVKFLFNEYKQKFITFDFLLLQACIQYNHDMANYFLDLQMKEIEQNTHKNEMSLFNRFSEKVDYTTFIFAFQYINEDIIVKMFKLYISKIDFDHLYYMALSLTKYLSTKMIISILDRVISCINNDNLVSILKSLKIPAITNFVNDKINAK